MQTTTLVQSSDAAFPQPQGFGLGAPALDGHDAQVLRIHGSSFGLQWVPMGSNAGK